MIANTKNIFFKIFFISLKKIIDLEIIMFIFAIEKFYRYRSLCGRKKNFIFLE